MFFLLLFFKHRGILKIRAKIRSQNKKRRGERVVNESERYDNFTNITTWRAALWFSNDEFLHNNANKVIRWFEDNPSLIVENIHPLNFIFKEWLRFFGKDIFTIKEIKTINWDEIQQSLSPE